MCDYEININPEYVDKTYHDEWGAAFLWLNDEFGVEYNLSYDAGECTSAIYSCFINEEDHLEDDTNKYIAYEINFDNPNWKQDLITTMKEAAEEFWNEV